MKTFEFNDTIYNPLYIVKLEKPYTKEDGENPYSFIISLREYGNHYFCYPTIEKRDKEFNLVHQLLDNALSENSFYTGGVKVW
jgi:hypothetical protein